MKIQPLLAWNKPLMFHDSKNTAGGGSIMLWECSSSAGMRKLQLKGLLQNLDACHTTQILSFHCTTILCVCLSQVEGHGGHVTKYEKGHGSLCKVLYIYHLHRETSQNSKPTMYWVGLKRTGVKLLYSKT
ncbi:hypothetical protein ILYODFUR_027401 [Ilyodon furcidens]|uniref:Uncharacterized protein n=1 Tax=Ilyodon furcidens TaxID=33524 RepID=A0ABV0TM83_9TELE